VRLAQVGILALGLGSGCLRFGYEAKRGPVVLQPDAATPFDAAMDAARSDAATPPDAGASDAEAGVMDAASPAPDAGMDAAAKDAATGDAAVQDAAASDASMSDAATSVDATTPDAASEAGSADPCSGRSDLSLCDGFESAAGNWSDIALNGSITRSTLQARSGSTSARATTGSASGSNRARFETQAFAQLKQGDIWARAYYYLPSSVTIDTYFSIMQLREAVSPYFGCSLVIRPTLIDLGGSITARFKTLEAFPRDQWTCVELHVQIDASAGTCEGYVDGMIATSSSAGNTLPAQGYSNLDVGICATEASQGPLEIYVDDVAAGTTRIGCD